MQRLPPVTPLPPNHISDDLMPVVLRSSPSQSCSCRGPIRQLPNSSLTASVGDLPSRPPYFQSTNGGSGPPTSCTVLAGLHSCTESPMWITGVRWSVDGLASIKPSPLFPSPVADPAEDVAAFLVPRVRQVPMNSVSPLTGAIATSYVKYLTKTKAFSQILSVSPVWRGVPA